jgi:hypothetical protein
MNRRLATLALALYPLAFRRRYGEEMRALLHDAPPSTMGVLDLLRGALTAHLRPPPALAPAVAPEERVRASASAVLACWVAFAATGLGFYKTTEDARFTAAGETHGLLGGAHLAVQILAVVGSAAVLIGAAPLVVAALCSARRERRLRRLVAIPPTAVGLFALLTGLMVALAQSQHAQHASTVTRGLFVLWLLSGLACGAACVLAARRALFAIAVKRTWLIAALGCGAVATGAMVAIALASVVYTLTLSLDASAVAATANGPLGGFSVAASLAGQAVLMALAASLATITTARGWRAGGRLVGPQATG